MKIILAEPNPEVRSALCLLFSQIPEVSEVIESDELVHLLVQLTRNCPELVLMDLELLRPLRSRFLQTTAEFVSVVKHLCPQSKLIITCSQFEMEKEIMASGADGFFSKTDLPEMVLADIARLARINSNFKSQA